MTRPLLVIFAVAFAFSWLIEAIMITWHLPTEFIICGDARAHSQRARRTSSETAWPSW